MKVLSIRAEGCILRTESLQEADADIWRQPLSPPSGLDTADGYKIVELGDTASNRIFVVDGLVNIPGFDICNFCLWRPTGAAIRTSCF
jgi:hypothetical protein